MKRIPYLIVTILVLTVAVAAVGRSLLNRNYHTYTVKKGESIYGIAKMQGWDQDTLTAWNPTAAAKIDKGQTLWYPVEDSVCVKTDIATDTISIVVSEGETLDQIAYRYNTTVAEIFLLNPTLDESAGLEGVSIALIPNSRYLEADLEYDSVPAVKSFNQHKVLKDETWFGIAQNNGITVEQLTEANGFTPENATLKKGQYISVPNMELVAMPRYILPERDPRELTAEGRKAIHDSIMPVYIEESAIDVAIVLNVKDNITRDIEFLKGWMLAADALKTRGTRINISVFDTSADSLSTIPALIADGKLDDAKVIIYTNEKDKSPELSQYAAQQGKYIINPFKLYRADDVHNDYTVMILPPTELFNDVVANGVKAQFPEHNYIFIGDLTKPNHERLDQNLYSSLDSAAQADAIKLASIDDLTSVKLSHKGKYLICAPTDKKVTANAFYEAIAALKEKYPDADISVLGRAAWLQYMEKMNDVMRAADTYIPSRFYADNNAENLNSFNTKYRNQYGHKPRNNWPVFSYLGYDLGIWLMDQDNNLTYRLPAIGNTNPLQTDIEILSLPGVGKVNKSAYLLHMPASGEVVKIKIDEPLPAEIKLFDEPEEEPESEE